MSSRVLSSASARASMGSRTPIRRHTLLVLRALGLGDLLTAVPALRALGDAFAEHRLVLACPRSLAPLALLTGAVDEVVHAEPLRALPEEAHGADVAVNLHGSGPESHRVLLATGPRRLLAYASVEAGIEGPAFDPDEHEVARWCGLLDAHGIPADPSRLDVRLPSGGDPVEARGATVVHPGAAAPSRRWPAERFAAVARAERERGRPVLLTGSPDEGGLARRVARLAGLGPGSVRAGRTDLVELGRLVVAADRVVSGDTGVAHLATAVGTPSVVLFGPTSPDRWGPPPERRSQHRVLWAGREGDPRGREPDPGLLELTVDDVLAELRALDREAVAA